MSTTQVLIFALITWGITSIVTFGAIFRPIRQMFARFKYTRNNLGYLLHCPMCTGFWAGLGVHFLEPVSVPVQDAFIGAGICYLRRAVFVYACEDCAMNLPEFNETMPVSDTLGPAEKETQDGIQSSDNLGEGRQEGDVSNS